MNNLLKTWGLDGNGKIEMTEANKRIIGTEEIAIVSLRKIIQEAKKMNIKFEIINSINNEFGAEDLKVNTVDEEGNETTITVEVSKKEITHSYY